MTELRLNNLVVYLPNPQLGNTLRPLGNVNKKYAMDGTMRSYVSKSNDYSILYTFILTRDKALEFEEFITRYMDERMTLVTLNGERYSGYIMNNPFEFRYARRGAPAGDTVEVTMEFQGEKLN